MNSIHTIMELAQLEPVVYEVASVSVSLSQFLRISHGLMKRSVLLDIIQHDPRPMNEVVQYEEYMRRN